MDFHSLSRRELQSLCKLNKIPANITNVAMADALQSFEIVVGIEEFLKVSQSETADLVESVETVEAISPKAPLTRCRTSTRQKVKPAETENLQTTVTRTTRRGSKQPPREVEESKNDMLKTPAVSRTSRKVPATSTRRNVNNQLSECETEAKDGGLVENKYSTRRSTRLTEKKSAASRVKKGVEKAVMIDSFLDQGNSNTEVEDICKALEKLDVVVMEEEATHKGEEADAVVILKPESDENLEVKIAEVYDVEPELDGVSSPSEEATHKSGEEGEDCDEVNILKQDDNLKPESDENSEVKTDEAYDVEPESDGISSPSEEATHKSGEEGEDCDEVNLINQVLDDNLKNSEGEVDEVQDPKPDSYDISSPSEDAILVQKVDSVDSLISAMKEHKPDEDDTSNPSEDEKFVVVQEEISDCVLESGDDAELGHKDTPCANSEMIIDNVENPIDELITNEIETMPENTVDAIPTIDDMAEEVEDLKPEIFTENNVYEKCDADSGLTQAPLILRDITGHPTQVTPIKNKTGEVEELKPEFFTENNENEKSDVDMGPTHVTTFKNMSSVVSDDKENIVAEGKIKKKDENEKIMSFSDLSIRQLKKQLKELTLKSHNSKEEAAAAAAATRPALQALCENQMAVGGEAEN